MLSERSIMARSQCLRRTLLTIDCTLLPARDFAVYLYKADQLLPSRNETMDVLLNLLEARKAAALTFQVIEKRSQAYELAVAVAI